MADLKFLDLATGLPYLWQQILARFESHNSNTTAHSDIRDAIEAMELTVENKVDKVSGKGLSTNDFTADLKTKLDGIETGANKIVVDSAASTTSTNPLQNKVITAAINMFADELISFSNLRGAANGFAPLNESSKIDSIYLPSSFDEIIEYDNKASFPTTGEAKKVYYDKATGISWKWSGSTYVAISSSIVLGNTSSTAYRGDYGEIAYNHATTKGSAFASGLYKITTNAQGHVTAATAVAKADITALGIPAQDTTYTSLKNPNALTISLNGTSQGAYDGSAAKSINISPSTIGAAASSHTHSYLPLAGGKITGNLYIQNGNTSSICFQSDYNNTTVENALIGYYSGTLSTARRWFFRQHTYASNATTGAAPTSGVYEEYGLPNVDLGKTANSYYDILTTKKTITLSQGGTGGTTQTQAFNNVVAPGGQFTGRVETTSDLLVKGHTAINNNTNYPYINFIPSTLNQTLGMLRYIGSEGSSTESRFSFLQYSRSSTTYEKLDNYEGFNLPKTDADLSANKTYTIITTKNLADADGRYLKLSGGEMSGYFIIKNHITHPGFNITVGNITGKNNVYIYYQGDNSASSYNRLIFRLYSRNSSTGDVLDTFEEFPLPVSALDRATNASYPIITTKNPEALDGRWLKKSGDTMTGDLALKSCRVSFKDSNDKLNGQIIYYADNSNDSCMTFRQYSLTSSTDTTPNSHYENYKLPRTSIGRTSDVNYNIYTSKNPSQVFNDLGTASAKPGDEDYYICQYAGGETGNIMYIRRKTSALLEYIQDKCDTRYLKTDGGGTISGSLTLKTGDSMPGFFLTSKNVTTSGNNAFIYYFDGTSANYNHLRFRVYSKNSSTNEPVAYYEEFQLPYTNLDRTSHAWYSIATNKNPEVLDGRWLLLSGGTLTGRLDVKSDLVVQNSGQYPVLRFASNGYTVTGGATHPAMLYFNTGSASGLDAPRFYFRVWSPTAAGAKTITNYYEDYTFPPCDNARTSTTYYRILTEKTVIASTTQPSNPIAGTFWFKLKS